MPEFVAYRYRPSMLRSSIYYTHRLVVSPALRSAVIWLLRWVIGRRVAASSTHPLLASLKADGIVRLGQCFTEAQCDDILAYLADKPVYDKGLRLERAGAATQAANISFGAHMPATVIDCPHIMELVSSPAIVQLAADYLGCDPTLSCLAIEWSFPTKVAGAAQKFHRDAEDWRCLRFLVYLTDVDEGCGPHVYVKASHRDKLPLRMRFYPPEEIAQQYGRAWVEKVLGRRGSGIAADTCGIQKSELPTHKPRLVLNFTFSILPNALASYHPRPSRHSPDLLTYTNRLFLE